MQKFITELQTMTVNKTKKSCNIMQKFILHTSKIPAI